MIHEIDFLFKVYDLSIIKDIKSFKNNLFNFDNKNYVYFLLEIM